MSTLPTKRIRELYGMATRWDSDERTASIRESNLAEFDAWLAQHDAEVAANTTLGIAHRLDTDDPRVGEQLVQFEDEWRKEARGEKDGAA